MSSKSKAKPNRNRCVMKSCRIRNNEKQNDKESGVTFFKVPQLSFNEWRALIPCLAKTSHVCSRHFDEDDILKGQKLGTDVFLPYLRWQLKAGAMPKHWLNEESKPRVRKSKSVTQRPKVLKAPKSLPVNRPQDKLVKTFIKIKPKIEHSTVRAVLLSLSPNNPIPPQKKDLQPMPIGNQRAKSTKITAEYQFDHDYAMPVQQEELPKHPNPISHYALDSAPNVHFTEPIENQDCATSTSEAPHFFVDNEVIRCFSSYVKLPSELSWVWSLNKKDNMLCCSNCSLSRDGFFVIKTVRIISKNSCTFFINGNPVAPKDVVWNFSTYQELSALFQNFSEKRYCEGFPQQSLTDVQVSGRLSSVRDSNGRWRSKNCTYIADSKFPTDDICSKCGLLKKYSEKISTNLSKKKEAKEKTIKQKFRMYRRRIHNLEILNQENSVEIEKWRQDFWKLHTKWKRKLQEEFKCKRKIDKKRGKNATV